MTHSFACRHCGSPIAFEDDERGFEVYCRSCGRANMAPLASEERPRRAASVFAEETAAPLDTVIGEQTCLCGAAVPVRVEDLGESVYCPSCAAEILVGQTLLRRERGARLAAARPEEGGVQTAAPPPQARSRLVRHLAWALLLAMVAGGGLWLFRAPRARMELLGRWVDTIGLSSAPARAALTKTVPENKPQPARRPEITLGLIDGLAAHPDAAAALVQARTWQKLLEKQGTGAEDPRRVRLAALVGKLEARLAPPPEKPPACLADFQRQVDALAAALKAHELQAAGKAAQLAEGILRRHPAELAGHDRRYQILQERLERELQMGSDAMEIRTLLERARKLAAAGKATEALESQAEARFLAMISALTPGEAAQLDELDQRVTPEVRYARGRRAVYAACDSAARGDLVSRNQEAHIAIELLAGLPEERISPLTARILPFVLQKKAGGGQVRGNQAALEEIRRRQTYESALEAYGRGQLVPLAAACRELETAGGGEEPVSNNLAMRCRQLLLEVLSWQIDQVEKTLHDANVKAVVAALTEAREILGASDFWRDQPVYQELEQVVGPLQGGRQAEGPSEAKGGREP